MDQLLSGAKSLPSCQACVMRCHAAAAPKSCMNLLRCHPCWCQATPQSAQLQSTLQSTDHAASQGLSPQEYTAAKEAAADGIMQRLETAFPGLQQVCNPPQHQPAGHTWHHLARCSTRSVPACAASPAAPCHHVRQSGPDRTLRVQAVVFREVGTPRTHRRFLGREDGSYGPIPSRRPAGMLGMPMNRTGIQVCLRMRALACQPQPVSACQRPASGCACTCAWAGACRLVAFCCRSWRLAVPCDAKLVAIAVALMGTHVPHRACTAWVIARSLGRA